MAQEIFTNVKQGTLRGRKVTSEATGKTFYSFQGIPYAKAPVGQLRFRPPQPPEHWKGVKNALKEGPVCPQNFSNLVFGEEDNCLCLNVYTKQWQPSEQKPVMVWIHGGAFEVGSGNTDSNGPDYLVEENVVIVTINYRVGVLGFLHVEQTDTVSNVGLRDQVAALIWVNENIAKFGGDPRNVTIFGISAGGCSIHFLTLSPSSKGLFHRAIAQSGNALLDYCNISLEDARKRAFRLGEILGYSTNDAQKLVDFLRTVPVDKLLRSQSDALTEQEKQHAGTCAFNPVVEKPGSDSFLPEPARDLIAKGKFQRVPFMTGVTSAEGKLALHPFMNCPPLEEVTSKFERSLNWNLKMKLGEQKTKLFAEKLKEFYFGESPVNDDTIIQYVDMQSDLFFNYPAYIVTKEQVKHSSAPIYNYQISYKQETPLFELPNSHPRAQEIPGATHGAEIPLLFHTTIPGLPPAPKTPAHEKTRKNIIKLFTNFAKDGNPTSGLNVDWPTVKNGYYPYLDINDELTVHENLNKERMEFLDNLFSLVSE